MKTQRGKLSYGSTAVGHYGHVSLMAISDAQDAAMVHTPYKGESPLVQDLVSGQIQMAFVAPSTIRPIAESGKVKLLAVSRVKRLNRHGGGQVAHQEPRPSMIASMSQAGSANRRPTAANSSRRRP